MPIFSKNENYKSNFQKFLSCDFSENNSQTYDSLGYNCNDYTIDDWMCVVFVTNNSN